MTAMSPLRRLRVYEDPRGKLISVEGSSDLPFDIARVYYILPSDGSARGFHAHRTLDQLMICVVGSCRIVLDDGGERSEFLLSRPDEGVTIPSMVWHEMHEFSQDAVLLVLASAPYDEKDYIRDYNDFLREAGLGRDDG